MSYSLTAFDEAKTRGRKRPIAERGSPFSRDVNVMDHLVVFRMIGKRQVFGGQSRSGHPLEYRFSHCVLTREVAKLISAGLRLNALLVCAIATPHDCAHCPMSHLGEDRLNLRLGALGLPKYDHAKVAPYILQEIADLNLSFEVLEGITYHSFSSGVMQAGVPAEYRAVALADKLAFSISDAMDARVVLSSSWGPRLIDISPKEAKWLYQQLTECLFACGEHRLHLRLDNLVQGVIDESREAGEISFSGGPSAELFRHIHTILVEHVYAHTDLRADIEALDRVLDLLERSDIAENPYFVYAMLDDHELRFLAKKSRFDWDYLGSSSLRDLRRRLPKRGDFSFLEPDFSWAQSS